MGVSVVRWVEEEESERHNGGLGSVSCSWATFSSGRAPT